ncbi:hypothetical protein PGTUg99_013330 [Puccinia graminis f. sp. tritici]|uniref:Uncharacterized protein n=1 Tax=Puccinia graminis f. sp. tritici TaxID=56615 RepID=A0A5B0NCL7_PUCGR|nr:hypothetical protein PGTUg99_013330 [Puccinia graminis f. sp. tritici]
MYGAGAFDQSAPWSLIKEGEADSSHCTKPEHESSEQKPEEGSSDQKPENDSSDQKPKQRSPDQQPKQSAIPNLL